MRYPMKRSFTFDIPDAHPCNDHMCTLQCTGVFKLPSDEEFEAMDRNGKSHVESTVHYQLCWEVGNTYPFGADPLKIKVLALNTIRALRQEVEQLRDTITALEPEEVEEPDLDTFVGLGGYTNAQVDEMLREVNELYRIPEKDRTDQQNRWIDELSNKLDDAGVHP